MVAMCALDPPPPCITQVLSFGSCDTEISFLPESKIPKEFESMIEEKSEEDAARSMAEV